MIVSESNNQSCQLESKQAMSAQHPELMLTPDNLEAKQAATSYLFQIRQSGSGACLSVCQSDWLVLFIVVGNVSSLPELEFKRCGRMSCNYKTAPKLLARSRIQRRRSAEMRCLVTVGCGNLHDKCCFQSNE